MRVFTAISVPDEIKKIIPELTRGKLPIPYVNITNLHITLNFLGELTDEEVAKVTKVFPSLIKDNRNKIHIEFAKFVNFRNQIHITLKKNENLESLQSELEESLIKEGFHFQNRQYYPHVKLGNMHIDNKLYRERKLENFPQEDIVKLNFIADNVSLFESKLLLHHAHHRPIIEIKLL
jgi:2'-5' RNA ligase